MKLSPFIPTRPRTHETSRIFGRTIFLYHQNSFASYNWRHPIVGFNARFGSRVMEGLGINVPTRRFHGRRRSHLEEADFWRSELPRVQSTLCATTQSKTVARWPLDYGGRGLLLINFPRRGRERHIVIPSSEPLSPYLRREQPRGLTGQPLYRPTPVTLSPYTFPYFQDSFFEATSTFIES